MTPRQRYPEIWAATFGAAWISEARAQGTPEERAEYAADRADAACYAWDRLLKRRNEDAGV